MVYGRFRSFSFTLRHSLKPVFPCVPHLSVAEYVVRRINAPKEPFHVGGGTLCKPLYFYSFRTERSEGIRAMFCGSN